MTNKLILGYKSLADFFTTSFGLKNPVVNFLGAAIATIGSFITQYVYDDAGAVYFLLFMIVVDAITGIWKSIKFKTFGSSRLPRILITMLLYCVLLAIGWNAAKYSSFYFWLPSALYGGFIAVLLISIIENLYQLGYVPKAIYEVIKEKLSIRKIFKLGEKKEKAEEKKKNSKSKGKGKNK